MGNSAATVKAVLCSQLLLTSFVGLRRLTRLSSLWRRHRPSSSWVCVSTVVMATPALPQECICLSKVRLTLFSRMFMKKTFSLLARLFYSLAYSHTQVQEKAPLNFASNIKASPSNKAQAASTPGHTIEMPLYTIFGLGYSYYYSLAVFCTNIFCSIWPSVIIIFCALTHIKTSFRITQTHLHI